MSEKACTKCGVIKQLYEFYRASGARDGHRGECKPCARLIRRKWYERNRDWSIENVKAWRKDNPERFAEYQRQYRARPERKRAMRDLYYRRTFGISADEFDALLAGQGGGCAICGKRPERDASLHLDHDHETGVVRGILCLSCNQGIGKFRDDAGLLERAARYLRGGGAFEVGDSL